MKRSFSRQTKNFLIENNIREDKMKQILFQFELESKKSRTEKKKIDIPLNLKTPADVLFWATNMI